MNKISQSSPIRGLNGVALALDGRMPPVADWQPDICREIDMHIDADGRWFYNGSPIDREAMVRLFSTILRRDDDDRYCLVTPVEKCLITVADVPFVVTGMDISGNGPQQQIRFATNVGDLVEMGNENPLRFVRDEKPGVFVPYVLVRGRLEARINRAIYYDLMDVAEEAEYDAGNWFGIWSGGSFWPIAPAAEIAAE